MNRLIKMLFFKRARRKIFRSNECGGCCQMIVVIGCFVVGDLRKWQLPVLTVFYELNYGQLDRAYGNHDTGQTCPFFIRDFASIKVK